MSLFTSARCELWLDMPHKSRGKIWKNEIKYGKIWKKHVENPQSPAANGYQMKFNEIEHSFQVWFDKPAHTWVICMFYLPHQHREQPHPKCKSKSNWCLWSRFTYATHTYLQAKNFQYTNMAAENSRLATGCHPWNCYKCWHLICLLCIYFILRYVTLHVFMSVEKSIAYYYTYIYYIIITIIIIMIILIYVCFCIIIIINIIYYHQLLHLLLLLLLISIFPTANYRPKKKAFPGTVPLNRPGGTVISCTAPVWTWMGRFRNSLAKDRTSRGQVALKGNWNHQDYS